jgi:hypothetical protein
MPAYPASRFHIVAMVTKMKKFCRTVAHSAGTTHGATLNSTTMSNDPIRV